MRSRSLLKDYSASVRDPGFWIYSTWLELVTKYRRSRLGLVWALLPPVLYMFGVGGFYAHLQGYDAWKFMPHLGMGYVLFRVVTVSLSESTSAYSAHSSFILDGRVRLTDYLLRVMAKALFYLAMAMPALTVMLALNPHFNPVGLLMAIPAFGIVLLNIGWMAVVVSVLGARLQDVHEFIGSALMFSFLFTPIIWSADQAPIETFRGGVARVNPLFHLVEVVRAPLLGEPVERLTYFYLAGMLVFGWIIAAFIYRRYARYVPVWV